MSEALYDRLAADDPDGLLRLIENGLPVADLTFAAESAGRIDPARSRPVLLRLLEHRDPVVREGALYGLVDLLYEAP